MSAKSAKKDKKEKKHSNPALPEKIETIRSRVTLKNQSVAHNAAVEDPDAFKSLGYDNSLDLAKFKETFKIEVLSLSESEMVFDMVGVDAPIANALRRILISEVPSMAIEKVKIFQNTSIIQDEVLAHRLGLVPIKADPRKFQHVHEHPEYSSTEDNTTVFTLVIECKRDHTQPDDAPIDKKFINSFVYSKDLQWVPQGRQAKKFAKDPIRVVNDEIVIAKLRPGQQIEAELWVEKGIGQTHAKWSPVATASYRLLPEVDIHKPILNERADALQAKCPMGVFDIEDMGKGVRKAVAARPRNCTMCRECIRDGELEEGEVRQVSKEESEKKRAAPMLFSESIELRRVRDHFIFSIESVGVYSPQDLLREAIKILKEKCRVAKAALHGEESKAGGEDMED